MEMLSLSTSCSWLSVLYHEFIKVFIRHLQGCDSAVVPLTLYSGFVYGLTLTLSRLFLLT